MKKILAVLMAAMLVLTGFAGCSSVEENSDEEVMAVKIGNTEFSVKELNFMYISLFNDMYSNVVSYYGENAAQVIDISKPLEEQMIDENMTWHEYLCESTLESLVNLTGIYEMAVAENFVLSETQQASLDGLWDQLETTATEANMTAEEYIALIYGEGMDFETIYNMTEFQYIAAAYATEYQGSIEISEEEIMAYYEENKNTIDTVTFRFFTSYYSDEEGALTAEEAKAQAESLAAVHTAEEFNALAYEYASEERKEYFEDSDATLFPGANPESIGIEEVSDWLYEEGRTAGDTMIYNDEAYNGYLAIMFEEIVSADYNFVDVRHILIMPEKDESGKASEEAWAEAEKKANEVYSKYLEGDKSEQSFKILAGEYSQDGNASNGGIYEDVYKGQMVTPFENWCFDEARQPGDTGIVETSFGYHIMYFVGEGENNLVSLVEPVLADQAFSEWIAASVEGVAVERYDAFETVGGMIDDIVAAAEKIAAEQNAEVSEETGNVTNEEVVSEESAEG